MSLIAKAKGSISVEPVPAGMHHGICYSVVDIGTQPARGQYPSRPKVLITWELPEERGDFDRVIGGKTEKVSLPRAISSRYTLSLSEKSNLRPMLQGWRGRPFTEEELDGFDIRNVIGANCLLNVIHNTNDGKTYANVASVTPLAKGMVKKLPENPPLQFTLEDFPVGVEVTFPENMPEWMETLIKQSEEYVKRASENPDAHPAPATEGAASTSLEEDVPF